MGLAGALCLAAGTIALPNPTPVQLPGAAAHADPMEDTIDAFWCAMLNLLGLDCEREAPSDDNDAGAGTTTGEGE